MLGVLGVPLASSLTPGRDALVEPTPARIVIFGMGRVGQGAYDEFVRGHGDVVLRVDRRDITVATNLQAGRNVIGGHALDRDFWERLRLRPCLQLAVLAVLAMNDHDANLEAARRLKANFPHIRIAATARYADQVTELQDAGADDAADLQEPAPGDSRRSTSHTPQPPMRN